MDETSVELSQKKENIDERVKVCAFSRDSESKINQLSSISSRTGNNYRSTVCCTEEIFLENSSGCTNKALTVNLTTSTLNI